MRREEGSQAVVPLFNPEQLRRLELDG